MAVLKNCLHHSHKTGNILDGVRWCQQKKRPTKAKYLANDVPCWSRRLGSACLGLGASWLVGVRFGSESMGGEAGERRQKYLHTNCRDIELQYCSFT